MQQSKVMTDFCRDYINWFNNGTPSNKIFNTNNGLCILWIDYILNKDDVSVSEVGVLHFELKQIFKQEKLDSRIPFNSSIEDYMNESFYKKCHLNEQRIKWVMEHAQLVEIEDV